MADIVYRVQDADGRGPWKPGFSHVWVEDREDHDNLVPWMQEFGNAHLRAIVGMWLGSGCRTVEQLRRWFTPSEYAKLRSLGYRAVKMSAGRMLGESKIQCLFERSKPLNEDVEEVELYPVVAAKPETHSANLVRTQERAGV